MPWYDALNRWLDPAQGIVRIGLIAIAIVSLGLAFMPGNHVMRTGWLVYLISP